MSQRPASTGLEPVCAEFERELRTILAWWSEHIFEPRTQRFFGEISAANEPVENADLSIVLATRLLWFFSEAAHCLGDPDALTLADYAAAEIRRKFVDPVHGGVYWLIDAQGRPLDPKKQGYAQAFAIYALCAHYRATSADASLELAKQIFELMEGHLHDRNREGYVEAMTREWQPLADMRLSDKDANCPKTMNTHLHVLEAYTALHLTAPSPATWAALSGVVELMLTRIYNPSTEHLRLFFEMDWTDRTAAVSFGHDIEASWLIWEACEALGDAQTITRTRPIALALARRCLEEGIDADGGLVSERHFDGKLDSTRVWWGQAEAMVGFLNAYQLTREPRFFDAFARSWAFVKDHQSDPSGEWSWYCNLDPVEGVLPYKAGFWKCPYHNGRAMIEIAKRLRTIQRT